MKRFRVSEDGEVYWTGKAYDVDHALEKCYDDGGPGSLVTVKVEAEGQVKISSTMSEPGWVKQWEGQY